jgi:hypothetical protein
MKDKPYDTTAGRIYERKADDLFQSMLHRALNVEL